MTNCYAIRFEWVVIFADYTKEDLKMEWISVEDELPKDDGEFLVCLYGDVTVKEFNPWTSGNGENSFEWFDWENIPGYGSPPWRMVRRPPCP